MAVVDFGTIVAAMNAMQGKKVPTEFSQAFADAAHAIAGAVLALNGANKAHVAAALKKANVLDFPDLVLAGLKAGNVVDAIEGLMAALGDVENEAPALEQVSNAIAPAEADALDGLSLQQKAEALTNAGPVVHAIIRRALGVQDEASVRKAARVLLGLDSPASLRAASANGTAKPARGGKGKASKADDTGKANAKGIPHLKWDEIGRLAAEELARRLVGGRVCLARAGQDLLDTGFMVARGGPNANHHVNLVVRDPNGAETECGVRSSLASHCFPDVEKASYTSVVIVIPNGEQIKLYRECQKIIDASKARQRPADGAEQAAEPAAASSASARGDDDGSSNGDERDVDEAPRAAGSVEPTPAPPADTDVALVEVANEAADDGENIDGMFGEGARDSTGAQPDGAASMETDALVNEPAVRARSPLASTSVAAADDDGDDDGDASESGDEEKQDTRKRVRSGGRGARKETARAAEADDEAPAPKPRGRKRK